MSTAIGPGRIPDARLRPKQLSRFRSVDQRMVCALPTRVSSISPGKRPSVGRPANVYLAAAQAHPVETENLFGFTLRSDVDEAGTFGVALETTQIRSSVDRVQKKDIAATAEIGR